MFAKLCGWRNLPLLPSNHKKSADNPQVHGRLSPTFKSLPRQPLYFSMVSYGFCWFELPYCLSLSTLMTVFTLRHWEGRRRFFYYFELCFLLQVEPILFQVAVVEDSKAILIIINVVTSNCLLRIMKIRTPFELDLFKYLLFFFFKCILTCNRKKNIW